MLDEAKPIGACKKRCKSLCEGLAGRLWRECVQIPRCTSEVSHNQKELSTENRGGGLVNLNDFWGELRVPSYKSSCAGSTTLCWYPQRRQVRSDKLLTSARPLSTLHEDRFDASGMGWKSYDQDQRPH